MRNPAVTRAVLNELQELGIRIAIDDFGTGYSALGARATIRSTRSRSIAALPARSTPPAAGSWCWRCSKSPASCSADVVAEGVETVGQRDMLRRHMAARYAQGYLFAKPMDGGFFGAFAR